MRIRFILVCVALTIGQATVTAAQSTSAADQIVVEGTRRTDRQIADFVKALTDAPSFGQIGRFHAPACPVAIGLSAAQNAAISARMRAVAAAANIGLAPAGCTPNVFVIVAPDKHLAIRELYRRYPAYFSGMSSKEADHLAARSEPVTAWQIASRLSADGQMLKNVAGADYYINESGDAPSRIRASTIPAFVASVVVIDIRAAAGLTVTQLADYAAMRTFADTSPSRAAGVAAPSILTIVDTAANQLVPVTLTSWDLAFLKSLYSTSNAYYAAYQRGDMEKVVKDELKRSGVNKRQ